MDSSMATEAAATAGQQSSTGGGDRWRSSTNWIVAGGSLHDSVSFETSYDDEGDDAPSSPVSKPCSLTMRPPPSDDGDQDSLPCEVTVCFKGKYELHRVYVKSTARTYEIYYSGNHASKDKEYLCTVRCGASGEEVETSMSSEEAISECENVDSKPVVMQVVKPHHDSNSSNEDGWIEVQIPDDSLDAYKGKKLSSVADIFSNSNPQVYYEATAEISDASPCFSITLRFLSLQMKTCVHIAEIYIYADPVDLSSPDGSKGMTENFGGNSLLAMFVPNLLQLPKLGTSKLQEKVSLNSLGLQKNLYDLPKADQPGSLGRAMASLRDIHSDKGDRSSELRNGSSELKHEYVETSSAQNVIDQKHSDIGPLHIDLVHEQAEVKPEIMQLGSRPIIADQGTYCGMTAQKLNPVQANKVVPEILPLKISQASQDQAPQCNHEGKHMSDTRINEMLGELLSRVGRIEEFCSRFEDNMMKPLICIETRLQRLEQSLDAFSSGYQCPQPSTRISAPEFPCDESDLEKQLPDAFSSGYQCPQSSSRISAPEFPCIESDLENDGKSNSSAAQSEETTNIASPLSDDFANVIKSEMHPGLVVKAPEFSNEDDECVQTVDNSGYSLNGGNKDKLRPSIDSALASALAAFMMEKPIADLMKPFELSNDDRNDLVLTNQRDSFVIKSYTDNDVRDTAEVVAVEPADDGSTLAVDMPTGMSERQNYDYNIRDKLTESTAFYDSLDVGMDHSSPTLPMPSDLRVGKPEASNDDDSIDCGKASESNDEVLHDDQATHASGESNSTSASSHLAEFKVFPSNQTSFFPTFETNNHESRRVPSMLGVPDEELREPHTENNGKDEQAISDSKVLSPEIQSEGIVAGSCEYNIEENDDKLELHEYSLPPIATQHGNQQQDLIHWLAVQSGYDVNKDSSNGEKESSSEESSFLCDKDQGDQSNVDGIHSLKVPVSADGYNGQDAEDYGSTKATVESSLLQDYFTPSSGNDPAGHILKVKPFLDVRPCYDEPIFDVKFAREESWQSGISLDILLCETYISDGKDCADGNEDGVSQLNYQGTTPVNQLLVEVEHPTSIDVVSDLRHDEDVQSPHHEEQPFPSLI